MDNKIIVIAPNRQLVQRCQHTFLKMGITIPIYEGLFESAVTIAEEQVAKGARVIISRGGTIRLLQSRVKVPIVEIRSNIYDVAYALKHALKHSRRVGAVILNKVFAGCERLADFMDVEMFEVVLLEHRRDVEASVLALRDKGAEVIIGGALAAEMAHKYGLKHVVIVADEASIREAVQDAVQTLGVETEKTERYETIMSILNSTSEGIIGVDGEGRVTNINTIARELVGCRGNPLGRYIGELSGVLDIGAVIATGQSRYNELIRIADTPLVLNCVPVVVEERISGAVVTLQRVRNIETLERKIRASLRSKGHVAKTTFDDIIGSSPVMLQAKEKARRFATTDSTLLILGETGVGKELFAQSVHNHSFRRDNPFVAINCAALPPSLLESELFGHVKGAFTGANPEGKAGIFEMAHTGTIFLDEIGEIPREVQLRLLRVIQEREVIRLGGDTVIPVNVRIISASNRNLREEVAAGRFREDLYYRLGVMLLQLPPLRERKEDIGELVRHFTDMHAATQSKTITRIAPDAVEALRAIDIPGNIRQLSNIVECAVALCDGRTLNGDLIREAVGGPPAAPATATPVHDRQADGGLLSLMEKQTIMETLARCGGNRKQAARELGISTVTLWRRLKLAEGRDARSGDRG